MKKKVVKAPQIVALIVEAGAILEVEVDPEVGVGPEVKVVVEVVVGVEVIVEATVGVGVQEGVKVGKVKVRVGLFQVKILRQIPQKTRKQNMLLFQLIIKNKKIMMIHLI